LLKLLLSGTSHGKLNKATMLYLINN
jgi:hypothetical protein